jgi:hypothetical protein
MKKTALTLLTLLYLLSAFGQELKYLSREYSRNEIFIGNEEYKSFKISSHDKHNGEIIHLGKADLFFLGYDRGKELFTYGLWLLTPTNDRDTYVLTLDYVLYKYLEDEEQVLERHRYYVRISTFYKGKIKNKISNIIHRTSTFQTLELIPIK